MKETAQDLPAQIGEVIGGYRLEEILGSGGMGVVYAATHALLARQAAVKVINPAYLHDQQALSRFFHEAKIVNEVRHPNIVDIFDFVEVENPRRVACIMEYLPGSPLDGILQVSRLSLNQCFNILLQLSDALIAVHRLNVIHRDLKPANVMIVGALNTDFSDVPSVKLLDFGIAKVPEAGGHQTQTGILIGTPAYMAPEQVAGEPATKSTDAYALAEILYELLAGKPVYTGPRSISCATKSTVTSATLTTNREKNESQHICLSSSVVVWRWNKKIGPRSKRFVRGRNAPWTIRWSAAPLAQNQSQKP